MPVNDRRHEQIIPREVEDMIRDGTIGKGETPFTAWLPPIAEPEPAPEMEKRARHEAREALRRRQSTEDLHFDDFDCGWDAGVAWARGCPVDPTPDPAPASAFERLLAEHGRASVEFDAAQKRFLETQNACHEARPDMPVVEMVERVIAAREQAARAAREEVHDGE